MPKKNEAIGPDLTLRVKLAYAVALVVLIVGLTMGYAELKAHDHDERYCPREVLDARLDALQQTAERIEGILEQRQRESPP